MGMMALLQLSKLPGSSVRRICFADTIRIAVGLEADALKPLAAHPVVNLPDESPDSAYWRRSCRGRSLTYAVLAATQIPDRTAASVTLASQLLPSLWVS